MVVQTKPRWPALLFSATVLSGVISTGATIAYYHYTTIVQDQAKELEQKQRLYQTEIEELKRRVVTMQTVVKSIPTPVTTNVRQCISLPFVNSVCSSIPVTHIEQRDVQVTVPAEDPAVKLQLDAKLKELETLSTKAVATQQKQVDLKELVDTFRQLISPVISLLVSLASLFIILSKKYKAESEKWAFGTLGTVLGFWLK